MVVTVLDGHDNLLPRAKIRTTELQRGKLLFRNKILLANLEEIAGLLFIQEQPLAGFWKVVGDVLSERAATGILHGYAEVLVSKDGVVALHNIEVSLAELSLNLFDSSCCDANVSDSRFKI